MKSASDYIPDEMPCAEVWRSIIREVQLDAVKEGMRRAANIKTGHFILPKGLNEGSMEAYHYANGYLIGETGKYHAILTAAEGLMEKDL